MQGKTKQWMNSLHITRGYMDRKRMCYTSPCCIMFLWASQMVCIASVNVGQSLWKRFTSIIYRDRPIWNFCGPIRYTFYLSFYFFSRPVYRSITHHLYRTCIFMMNNLWEWHTRAAIILGLHWLILATGRQTHTRQIKMNGLNMQISIHAYWLEAKKQWLHPFINSIFTMFWNSCWHYY